MQLEFRRSAAEVALGFKACSVGSAVDDEDDADDAEEEEDDEEDDDKIFDIDCVEASATVTATAPVDVVVAIVIKCRYLSYMYCAPYGSRHSQPRAHTSPSRARMGGARRRVDAEPSISSLHLARVTATLMRRHSRSKSPTR